MIVGLAAGMAQLEGAVTDGERHVVTEGLVGFGHIVGQETRAITTDAQFGPVADSPELATVDG